MPEVSHYKAQLGLVLQGLSAPCQSKSLSFRLTKSPQMAMSLHRIDSPAIVSTQQSLWSRKPCTEPWFYWCVCIQYNMYISTPLTSFWTASQQIIIDAACVLTDIGYAFLSGDCIPAEGPDAPRWLEILSDISLFITTFFLLEIPFTIWAFGLDFYHPCSDVHYSALHLFDAIIIVTTFTLEFVLKGKERELAALLILLRLWRLVKLVGGRVSFILIPISEPLYVYIERYRRGCRRNGGTDVQRTDGDSKKAQGYSGCFGQSSPRERRFEREARWYWQWRNGIVISRQCMYGCMYVWNQCFYWLQ